MNIISHDSFDNGRRVASTVYVTYTPSILDAYPKSARACSLRSLKAASRGKITEDVFMVRSSTKSTSSVSPAECRSKMAESPRGSAAPSGFAMFVG